MAQNAPGKHYREGLSLVGALRMFPDDDTAERWFIAKRWADEPYCPHCGSLSIQSGAAHKTMPYRCRDCRKRFSVRTGTAMDSSNLGYQVWALALYLLTTGIKGTSSMKLHRDLGVTQKTAWHLAHRIRGAMDKPRGPFAGPVEVDETFVGGKEKNKHRNKKIKHNHARGTDGKSVVIGARDRATNAVSASIIPDTTSATLQGFVGAHAAEGPPSTPTITGATTDSSATTRRSSTR